MATRDEIVDQIAGFALFADLTTPQLERIAHTFDEEVYTEGSRVLRQGISGSAFHIILDGEAAVVIDGEQRATLGRGDFFGEVSILDRFHANWLVVDKRRFHISVPWQLVYEDERYALYHRPS